MQRHLVTMVTRVTTRAQIFPDVSDRKGIENEGVLYLCCLSWYLPLYYDGSKCLFLPVHHCTILYIDYYCMSL